ncbi:TPA: hypothetical protein N0F65_009161 [Lagenidium giganteum]|uniref:Uncharacterized protein n=1 Tax=Lagenidium giganteum TaxID=4803 RepID=A0AAV2YTY2_9STRA|nr:TPA: hypothetical protein N0F65_009161 [Lagenidium giganteum]
MVAGNGTAQPSNSSSSSRAEVSLPPVIPVGGVVEESPGDGSSCAYFARRKDEKCRKPRSCRSCLNDNVKEDEGGCVLTSVGLCRPMETYDLLHDFRNNKTTGRNFFFPSANTSYCDLDDVACERCGDMASAFNCTELLRPARVTENVSMETARHYCVGTNGCICLAVCESSQWIARVPSDCPQETTPPYVGEKDSYRTFIPLFMVLQIALLGMLIYRRTLFFNERRRNVIAEGPYNNVNAISSPSNRLELTGWRAMQQDLIQKERKRRGCVNLNSPRRNSSNADIPDPDALPVMPVNRPNAADSSASWTATELVVPRGSSQDDSDRIYVMEMPGSPGPRRASV